MAESNGKAVLVTGGAGYIGSHCVVTLQEAGYEVIALDNFANSVDDGCDGSLALKRVEKITGKPVKFYKCDLLDTTLLEKIFHSVSKTIEMSKEIQKHDLTKMKLFVSFGVAQNRFGYSLCRYESCRRIDAISIVVLQK